MDTKLQCKKTKEQICALITNNKFDLQTVLCIPNYYYHVINRVFIFWFSNPGHMLRRNHSEPTRFKHITYVYATTVYSATQ